jgi:hypothetical protein
VESLDRQVERVMEHLHAKPNDLERYIYLIGLSDAGVPEVDLHSRLLYPGDAVQAPKSVRDGPSSRKPNRASATNQRLWSAMSLPLKRGGTNP